jgi:hypothetical protein
MKKVDVVLFHPNPNQQCDMPSRRKCLKKAMTILPMFMIVILKDHLLKQYICNK